MAVPESLTYDEKLDWINVVDDNNVPPGARPVEAADLIKYEQTLDALVMRSNSQDILIDGQATQITDLGKGAAAAQHAPSTALTTAVPSAVTTINAALTVAFVVPPSGRVILELSQHVKMTTKGRLQWIVADSAALTTIRSTITVVNNVHEGYVTARRLITGLAAGAQMSWVWRHQVLSPGVAALQIGTDYPALITVRAA